VLTCRFVSKVGPFPNPQETYPYYSLPLCRPEKLEHFHSEGFGETILGYDLIRSAMKVAFREKVVAGRVCSKSFTAGEAEQLRHAVQHEFWYQMFLDDLPLWGMVGEGQRDSPYVFTHTRLDIGYNGDRVIEVNLTSQNPETPRSDTPTEFTYEVSECVHAAAPP
jgi:transmembrane 9 superfamily protein 3